MKHKKKTTPRTKIIKDVDFYKLWKAAEMADDELKYVSDNTTWPYKKYKIEYDVFIVMLHKIYQLSKLTFKEIIDKNQSSKTKVSNSFCIPIRTIEDWYSGKNRCPGYIKLMLLRYFHMFELGKYIRIECVYNYDSTIPRIYKKEESAKEEPLSVDYIEKTYASELILSKTDYLDEIINRKKITK